MLVPSVDFFKAKARAKVAIKRKRDKEEEIISKVASRIPVPSDGEPGKNGRDAPTLEEILKEIKPLIPESKILHTSNTIREEIDEAKLRRLIQEEIPEPRTPEIQIIERDLDLEKLSSYLTVKDFNTALQRIDKALQNSRGGGARSEIPSETYQFISSVSDFPRPKDKVITLQANKVYFLCGDIDLLGNRLILQENTCLLGGSSENASLTSTGLNPSEYMITTDWTFPCRHITFRDVTNCIGVNLNGESTDANLALDWTGVNFIGCSTNIRCGDIGNFIFDKGAILGSGSFEFFGAAGTIGVANSLFVGSGDSYATVSIEATANISRRIRILYSSFVVFGSTVGLDVSTSATISNEAYILDTCNFSGGATYLTGVQSSNNKALFVNNIGIQNSADIAQYYMNGNTTPTVISGIGSPVKVLGSTTNSAVTSKFTHTDNRATYVGALNQYFKITATLSLTANNGNQIGTYIAKNGTVAPESEIYVTTNAGGRAENVTVQNLVFLQSGDYIEIFVENNSAIANITVTDLNVIIE